AADVGVKVDVEVATLPGQDGVRVKQEVEQRLLTYLNPLVGGAVGRIGGGWPFGAAVHKAPLYALVADVPGVAAVKRLDLYRTDLVEGRESALPEQTMLELEDDALVLSDRHVVTVVEGGG